MEFFCPFCQTRNKSTELGICLDDGNMKLRGWIDELGLAGADNTRLGHLRDLLAEAEKESDKIGFLRWAPPFGDDGREEYQVAIGFPDLLRAFNRAFDVVEESRKRSRKPRSAESPDTREVANWLTTLAPEKPGGALFEFTVTLKWTEDTQGTRVLDTAQRGEAPLQKVCWGCGRPTFQHAGLFEEKVIGLLGDKRSGKSTCIAATINAFNKKTLRTTPEDVYFLVPEGDHRWAKFRKDLWDKYLRGEPVEKTEGEDARGSSLCVSVLFTLALRPGDAKRKSLIVTFIDMPGEFFGNPKTKTGLTNEWYREYQGLYKHVDVFWFCLDFAQLGEGFSKAFLEHAGHPGDIPPNTNSGMMEENLQNLEKALRSSVDWVFPPTAIILTKSDEALSTEIHWKDDYVPSCIFSPEVEDEERFYSTTSHALIASAFRHESQSIGSALFSLGCEGGAVSLSMKMIHSLERVFHRSAFFSTSGYGHAALPHQAPIPFRARLPMLWTLAVLGKASITVKSRGVYRHGVLGRKKYVPDEIQVLASDHYVNWEGVRVKARQQLWVRVTEGSRDG